MSTAHAAAEYIPPIPREIGARIFSDPRLSSDGKTSCASCHQPNRAFTDGLPLARGSGDARGLRNTPSLAGASRRATFGWDGAQTRLEQQVLRPFTDPREMALADRGELLARVAADAGYRRAFIEHSGAEPTIESIGQALAAFVATLTSGRSAFDRHVAGDTRALTEAQRRGWQLFRGKAGCVECHRVTPAPASFADDAFHRAGVGLPTIAPRLRELVERVPREPSAAALDADVAELGRFLVTRDPKDIGAYRTPSLRNVAQTAPYFHDGSAATLDEAVAHELYYHAIPGRPNRGLTPAERSDLTEFLRALTDEEPGT